MKHFGFEEIEVKNFELHYDGMYWIYWGKMEFRVYLELNTILKMLEIEGLGINEVNTILEDGDSIKFNKVALSIWGKGESSLVTSVATENYQSYSHNSNNLYLIEVDLKESLNFNHEK